MKYYIKFLIIIYNKFHISKKQACKSLFFLQINYIMKKYFYEIKEMNDMQISKDEIIHIAKLANLNLTNEEIDKYTNDMEDILNFANTVNNLNTDNVEGGTGISEKANVFRKDEIEKSYDREELLKNAPSQDEGMFRIPKVIN